MEDALAEYGSFEVYEESTDAVCVADSGERPVSCRWRISNKGDNVNPNVRARLIARQMRQKGWAAIFAATPPLWVFRYLCAMATMDDPGVSRTRKMMIIDLKRAYFHSYASGQTFVKPPHLVGTNRCWRLLKSMYGTLPAAGEFPDTLNYTLVECIWMRQGMSSPLLLPL